MTTIILGLDGASVDVISRMCSLTSLPNFERLLQPGQFTALKSVYPYLTGPAWASLFTGVNPGKHGIFDQVRRMGSSHVPSNYTSISLPFLWDYASWAGKSVLCLGVPFMYPAPYVNGVYVTGRFCPKVSSYPPHLESKFDLSGYDYSVLARLRSNRTLESTRGQVYRIILESLQKRINLSIQLFDIKQWDLAIMVDSLPDDILHIAYDDERILCKIFKLMDEWLGQIMLRMKKGDTLMVVSDHGFTRLRQVFYLRRWLWAKGYLHPNNSLIKLSLRRLIYKSTGILGLKPNALPLRRIRKLRGTEQKGHSSRNEVDPVGFSYPTAWIRLSAPYQNVQHVSSKLKAELGQLIERGILNRVLDSHEVYWGDHELNSPGQIIIECTEGTVIDTRAIFKKTFLQKSELVGRGTHSLYGILAVHGLSVRLPDEATLYDVTPFCLDLLGIVIPSNLDGKTITRK
jgi:predicted AlkP superfamily phosphohydrolase/phosphomutase